MVCTCLLFWDATRDRRLFLPQSQYKSILASINREEYGQSKDLKRKEENPESGAGIKLVTLFIYQLESYDFTKSKSTTLEVQFRLGNCNFYPFFVYIYRNAQLKVSQPPHISIFVLLQYVSVFFLTGYCINILIYETFFIIKPLGYQNITNRAPTYHASNKQMLIYVQFCFQRIAIYALLQFSENSINSFKSAN